MLASFPDLLTLQATNAGVRRPGNEASTVPCPCLLCGGHQGFNFYSVFLFIFLFIYLFLFYKKPPCQVANEVTGIA